MGTNFLNYKGLMASLLFLLFLCPFYVLRETSIRPIRGDAGLKREILRKRKGNGKRIDIRTYPHLLLLIHLPSVTKSAQRKLRKEAT